MYLTGKIEEELQRLTQEQELAAEQAKALAKSRSDFIICLQDSMNKVKEKYDLDYTIRENGQCTTLLCEEITVKVYNDMGSFTYEDLKYIFYFNDTQPVLDAFAISLAKIYHAKQNTRQD
jgi:hypothetical protein